MSPESCGLMLALTVVSLLLAASGAVLLFKGAHEDSDAPSLVLSDAGMRFGDGASVLRFRLGVRPPPDRPAPLMQTPVALGDEEFRQLLAFITNGLPDPKARPENLRKLIPARPPSGRPVHSFQP